MPVTEAEALAAIPRSGWVRRYVIHGVKQTTSPLVYHLGVGVTTLAATCPINYGTFYAGTLRANNFCLLAGRSGEDAKSTAVNIGRELLNAAAPPLVGDFPGSPEGLVESLSRTPSQVIPISEFGKFLASAQKGYYEPIKATLAELWESIPTQRAKVNKKVVRVDNPRLSISAACSIPYLEKHTLSEDWTGGFMGRWMVLYGRMERMDPDPIGDRSDEGWLVDELRRRSLAPSAGWCLGLSKSARTTWDDWYYDVMGRRLPNHIVGIRSRAPTIARKVALLYGWDFGPAQVPEPWEMDDDVLIPAIALTELHISSLVSLADMIADHPAARLRRAVLAAIDEKGGMATLGEILGVLKMTRKPIAEALDALMEEGAVVRSRVNGDENQAYVRKK